MKQANPQTVKVDWSAMSDAQLGYQADCFELHEGKIPRDLQRELDKRYASQEQDPMGSTAQFQLAERIVGA